MDAAHVAASVVVPWSVMAVFLFMGLVITCWVVLALVRHAAIERRLKLLEDRQSENELRDKHLEQMLQKISHDQERSNEMLNLIVKGYVESGQKNERAGA